MSAAATSSPDQVPGRSFQLPFPTSVEPLRRMGCEFLTRAFHASGALAADNRVVDVTAFNEFVGGGMGRKVKLRVRYQKPDASLHDELFVKFTRDFGDPLRALFAPIMEPETRFALLSMKPGFPIAVPRCYFADYDPDTQTGILITESIRFGVAPIEPFHDKCLDYELPQPLEHYQALVRAIARLAGAHKVGRFGSDIDAQFPFTADQIREHDLIPYSSEQLSAKIATIAEFARKFPRLLPSALTQAAFLERFAGEAQQFLAHERALKQYLNARREVVALCHWNANVDNAWFWRNSAGELEAGLLDWGSVSQMNVAQSIFGVLCAVETDFWNAHADELIELFAAEYRAHGGAALDVGELRFHTHLFVALLGMAWMLDAPSIIQAQLPALSPDDDRFSPTLRNDFLSRAQLHLLTVFLNAWQREDFGAALQRFLRR